MSALVDTYITYRIITTLVKPWNKQDAYEFGIIDEKGKVLRKAKTLKTGKEKESYTMLIRFIFSLYLKKWQLYSILINIKISIHSHVLVIFVTNFRLTYNII